jgi:hypothetical protein
MKKILALSAVFLTMSAISMSSIAFTGAIPEKASSGKVGGVTYGEQGPNNTREANYILKMAKKGDYEGIVIEYEQSDLETKRQMRYALHELSKKNNDKRFADELDSLAMTFLKNDNSRMVEYWTESIQYNGMLVYQNDSLFDLERINLPLVSDLSAGKGYVSNEMKEATMTSFSRMKKGLPATGPDGQDVVLCRLIYDSNAAYFEMSKTDAIATLTYLNSGMTFNQACLDRQFTVDYWPARNAHFIDEKGNKKDKH